MRTCHICGSTVLAIAHNLVVDTDIHQFLDMLAHTFLILHHELHSHVRVLVEASAIPHVWHRNQAVRLSRLYWLNQESRIAMGIQGAAARPPPVLSMELVFLGRLVLVMHSTLIGYATGYFQSQDPHCYLGLMI